MNFLAIWDNRFVFFLFPSSSSSEHVSSIDIVLISIVFADPSPAMDRTGRYSILLYSIIRG